MFLVPLDSPGIEIQGIRTVDGDRTNIVYYSDVRVDDKYRLGEVQRGLDSAARAAQHRAWRRRGGARWLAGHFDHDAPGGFDVGSGGQGCGGVTRPDANGRRLLDDRSVGYRLGRSVARMEAALSAPNIFGRVAIAQTMRDISPDLMDLLGAASALPYGTDGAADDGSAEYVYRFAPLVGIYGGTLEVFRNMIAQYTLGLGKPAYAAPVK